MRQIEKTEKAKNMVLNSAEKLFSEQGYDETTLQDIIDDSKVSRGAIYHHFKNKHDILSELTRRTQEEINSFFKQVKEDTNLDSKEKIKSIIFYFQNNLSRKNLVSNNWIEKIPFALLDNVRCTVKSLAPIFAEILQQGVDKDEISCENPELAAELILILTDIWLDPIVFSWNEIEGKKRIEYLLGILTQIVQGLFTYQDIEYIKNLLIN